MMTPLFRVLRFGIVLSLASCGGSSGGGGGDPPDVAGRYSFDTGRFKLACSDGSAGSNAGISLLFEIVQDGDRISVRNNSSAPPAPGITIVRNTGLNGGVDSDGAFELQQKTAANIQGIPGTVQLTYEIEGQFTGKGWRGDYIYRFEVGGASCVFSAPFSGKKLKSRPGAVTPEGGYRETYPIDIYDRFNVVGSNVGAE